MTETTGNPKLKQIKVRVTDYERLQKLGLLTKTNMNETVTLLLNLLKSSLKLNLEYFEEKDCNNKDKD